MKKKKQHKLKGKKQTSEHIKKRADAKRGKKMTEEQKNHVSIGRMNSEKNRGKNHYLFGKHPSKEIIEKLRVLRLGTKLSEEHKNKISEWNKGKKISEEQKEKLRFSRVGWKQKPESNEKNRIAHLGKKQSPEAKEKQREAQRGKFCGEKSNFWKGGVTKKNQIIRHSLDYKLWREEVFKRDNWTCQLCKIRGGKIEADHIKRFSEFPELRFSLKNGRTLCRECHKKTDTYGNKTLSTVS